MNNYKCRSKWDEIIETDRTENKSDELDEFRNELMWICQTLLSQNISIQLMYGKQFENERSHYSYDEKTGNKTIYLSLPTAAGKDLLWVFIHEYGHALLDTAPEEKRGRQSREIDAWDKGWESVAGKFPDLEMHREHFIMKKNACAPSYPE